MRKIIISRTDNLGDVVLTLPIAGFLKKLYPQTKIYFLGKKYTAPVINTSIFVDEFLDKEYLLEHPGSLKNIEADAIIFIYPDKEIAKEAFKVGIPLRIGTSHRLFHWLYCNKLIHFSRKNSTVHESMLNFNLLQPFKIETLPTLKEIPSYYGMSRIQDLKKQYKGAISLGKTNIILHPKSKGSAREWPLSSFIELIKSLPQEKFHFIITGTQSEGDAITKENQDIFRITNVSNLTGQLSLEDLISLINNVQGLVACSTGPLHIAAALGIATFGIYPPIKPMNPERWGAIGKNVVLFYQKKACSDCRNSTQCACVQGIRMQEISSSMRKTYGL